MGSTRVHIVLAAEDRARYRAAAERAGETLSEWLRNAAEQRLSSSSPSALDSPERLDAFFARCDAVEEGVEPDWDEHLAVITNSRRGPPPP